MWLFGVEGRLEQIAETIVEHLAESGDVEGLPSTNEVRAIRLTADVVNYQRFAEARREVLHHECLADTGFTGQENRFVLVDGARDSLEQNHCRFCLGECWWNSGSSVVEKWETNAADGEVLICLDALRFVVGDEGFEDPGRNIEDSRDVSDEIGGRKNFVDGHPREEAVDGFHCDGLLLRGREEGARGIEAGDAAVDTASPLHHRAHSRGILDGIAHDAVAVLAGQRRADGADDQAGFVGRRVGHEDEEPVFHS